MSYYCLPDHFRPAYPRHLCVPARPAPVRVLCYAGQGTLIRTGPNPSDFTTVDSAKTPRVAQPTKAQKKAYHKNATFLKLHPVA